VILRSGGIRCSKPYIVVLVRLRAMKVVLQLSLGWHIFCIWRQVSMRALSSGFGRPSPEISTQRLVSICRPVSWDVMTEPRVYYRRRDRRSRY
jgi:hypothetical protein